MKLPPKIQTKPEVSKHAIAFDIETIAQSEERLLTLAPTFQPDSRLKDTEKIAASIEAAKVKYIERAALDWKTAEIVLIGFSDGKDFSCLCSDETSNIRSFFQIIEKMLADNWLIGGHNVRDFDLPMLVNRARVLKIPVPFSLLDYWNGRPRWHENIFDTLDMLAFGTSMDDKKGNGVDDVAKVLGLPSKLGDGSQFGALWKSDKQAAKAYCRQDVEIEVGIARACGIKF